MLSSHIRITRRTTTNHYTLVAGIGRKRVGNESTKLNELRRFFPQIHAYEVYRGIKSRCLRKHRGYTNIDSIIIWLANDTMLSIFIAYYRARYVTLVKTKRESERERSVKWWMCRKVVQEEATDDAINEKCNSNLNGMQQTNHLTVYFG